MDCILCLWLALMGSPDMVLLSVHLQCPSPKCPPPKCPPPKIGGRECKSQEEDPLEGDAEENIGICHLIAIAHLNFRSLMLVIDKLPIIDNFVHYTFSDLMLSWYSNYPQPTCRGTD